MVWPLLTSPVSWLPPHLSHLDTLSFSFLIHLCWNACGLPRLCAHQCLSAAIAVRCITYSSPLLRILSIQIAPQPAELQVLLQHSVSALYHLENHCRHLLAKLETDFFCSLVSLYASVLALTMLYSSQEPPLAYESHCSSNTWHSGWNIMGTPYYLRKWILKKFLSFEIHEVLCFWHNFIVT